MEFKPRAPDDSVNVAPGHPLAEAAWLIGGITLVGAVAVVSLIWAVELALPLISVEAEREIFASFADFFAEEADEGEPDPRVEPLRGLLAELAGLWPEAPYEFQLGFLDEDAPNALALPGGHILVTRGLLDMLESENEVAFVLAHELGHFANRDHLRALGRAMVLGLAFAAVTGSGAGAATPQTLGVVRTLAERGFSRDQERDADAFGLQLLQARYGHVNGSTGFFDRLQAHPAFRDEGGALGAWMATHPHSGDRIEALRALAAERGWPAAGALTPMRRSSP